MPTLQLTTKTAKQVWASPDGQRKIYELELDYNGTSVKAKTYSDVIATVGWSGEVESYEKQGRAGIETFVKQPPKESGGYAGGSGKSYGGKPQGGSFEMYLSYAKDIVVAMIAADKLVPKTTYSDLIDQTLIGAYTLYAGRPDAPVVEAPVAEKAPDVVHEVPEGPVDLSKVKEVFNVDQETEEELPWKDIKGE